MSKLNPSAFKDRLWQIDQQANKGNVQVMRVRIESLKTIVGMVREENKAAKLYSEGKAVPLFFTQNSPRRKQLPAPRTSRK